MSPFFTIAVASVLRVAAVDVAPDLEALIEIPIRASVAAHKLEPPFDAAARRYAASYVYTVICRGVGLADGTRAIELMAQANPADPYQATVLEILGIYVRAMPNRVDSAVCEKAFTDATSK